MATKRQGLNYQQRVAENFRQRADSVAQHIASRLGTPSDSTSITLEKQIEMWKFKVDHDPETGQPINAQDLMNQGMPIEQVVDKVFPYRSKMVNFQRPNPQDRVQFAEKMNKLAYPDQMDTRELQGKPGEHLDNLTQIESAGV